MALDCLKLQSSWMKTNNLQACAPSGSACALLSTMLHVSASGAESHVIFLPGPELTAIVSAIAQHATDGLSDRVWQWAGRVITDEDVCDVLKNDHFCRIIGQLVNRNSGDSQRRSRGPDDGAATETRSAKRVKIVMPKAGKIAENLEAGDNFEMAAYQDSEKIHHGYKDYDDLDHCGNLRGGDTDDYRGKSDEVYGEEVVQPVVNPSVEAPAAKQRQPSAEQGFFCAKYDNMYAEDDDEAEEEEEEFTRPALNPFSGLTLAEKQKQKSGKPIYASL